MRKNLVLTIENDFATSVGGSVGRGGRVEGHGYDYSREADRIINLS
jgi:hypothetical protein